MILAFLGPKRIEKGWLLFQRLLKFLLSKEETIEAKSEEPEESEVIEVKEEAIEAKSEEPEESEVIEVKQETIEVDLNEEESKAKINKKKS